MQYDRSLLTEDIIGAQPKHRNVYMNRLLPNQLTQEEQIRLQKQMPLQDIRFGRRRYENDVHHFCNMHQPSENQYFEKRNKKNNEFLKGDVKLHIAYGNYQDQSKYELVFDKGNFGVTDYQIQRIFMEQFLGVYRVKQFETKRLLESCDLKEINKTNHAILLKLRRQRKRRVNYTQEGIDHIHFRQIPVQVRVQYFTFRKFREITVITTYSRENFRHGRSYSQQTLIAIASQKLLI